MASTPHASFIQTWSGRKFDFFNPDPDSIVLEDIAHALSNICRFGGHISRFYSVADHSLNVARIVAWKGANLPTVRAALFHDAQEAFVGDIVTPFKHLLPQAMELERKLACMILRKFGIDEAEVDFAAVKRADATMLVVEAKALFNFPPLEDWTSAYETERILARPYISQSPREAEQNFLAAARLLFGNPCQPGKEAGWHDAEEELPPIGQLCEVLVRASPASPGTVMQAALVRQPGDWGKYLWVNGENLDFMVACVSKWRPLGILPAAPESAQQSS